MQLFQIRTIVLSVPQQPRTYENVPLLYLNNSQLD